LSDNSSVHLGSLNEITVKDNKITNIEQEKSFEEEVPASSDESLR
jgi:hypothetical protein